MNIETQLNEYIELFARARERTGDDKVAAVIVDQIGRDLRSEAIRAEREARLTGRSAAREQAAGQPGDVAPATQKQIQWLRDMGITVPRYLTKVRASAMLDEALAKPVAQ